MTNSPTTYTPESVLVTGGVVFVGSHMCDRLLERDDEVRYLDNH